MGYKENPQLANWVSTQRQEWKLLQTGKPCRITQDKIDKLDLLGFSWEAVRGGKRKKRTVAASTATSTHLADGTAKVLKKKRVAAKTKTTKKGAIEEGVTAISGNDLAETEAPIETVPVPIATVVQEDTWDEMFEALKQFKTKTGNTNVTIRYKEKPGLAAWVVNQRREFTLMKEIEAGIADNPNATWSLNEEKVRQLEELGFEFKPRNVGRPPRTATTTTVNVADAVEAKSGNLKIEDDDEIFVDSAEFQDAVQDEEAKDDKATATSDSSSKKKVRKNIPKGNPAKVGEVGGVKDAAEMLYSLGGA